MGLAWVEGEVLALVRVALVAVVHSLPHDFTDEAYAYWRALTTAQTHAQLRHEFPGVHLPG